MVVPDPDFLPSWAKRTLGLQGSYQELCGRAVILLFEFYSTQCRILILLSGLVFLFHIFVICREITDQIGLLLIVS